MFDPAQLSVLVVDDQRAIRTLVRESLLLMGCKYVGEADNGKSAMMSLQLARRHLVISDLNMPEMDGLELLRAVRAHPMLKNIGFIMLSSRGEMDLVHEAIKLGVNNYMTKPFTPAMLHKKVEAVFKRAA